MTETDAEGARLLIVDDLADNRNILSRRFGSLGYRTIEADNGLTAIRLVDSQEFDLVLLDIMMPGIDGVEVLKRIRTKRSPENLPIIMLTGKALNSKTVVDTFECGANDFLTKPIDFAVALARVRSQLARRQTLASLERSIDDLAGTNQKLISENSELRRLLAQQHLAAGF